MWKQQQLAMKIYKILTFISKHNKLNLKVYSETWKADKINNIPYPQLIPKGPAEVSLYQTKATENLCNYFTRVPLWIKLLWK